MSSMLLTVNSDIKSTLRINKIGLDDGINYLICIFYNINPSYIPEDLKRKVLATNIVTKDYEKDEIKWNIPLFEEIENGFEWISEWMDLFKKVNPERRGTKKFVLIRMKKFFANNPSIRKEEVFKATTNYLKTISEPKYCKKSHKFIYEIDGSSMLLDYVDLIQNTDKINEMIDEDII